MSFNSELTSINKHGNLVLIQHGNLLIWSLLMNSLAQYNFITKAFGYHDNTTVNVQHWTIGGENVICSNNGFMILLPFVILSCNVHIAFHVYSRIYITKNHILLEYTFQLTCLMFIDLINHWQLFSSSYSDNTKKVGLTMIHQSTLKFLNSLSLSNIHQCRKRLS